MVMYKLKSIKQWLLLFLKSTPLLHVFAAMSQASEPFIHLLEHLSSSWVSSVMANFHFYTLPVELRNVLCSWFSPDSIEAEHITLLLLLLLGYEICNVY